MNILSAFKIAIMVAQFVIDVATVFFFSIPSERSVGLAYGLTLNGQLIQNHKALE
jgi:hypothetical protein